MIAHPSQKILFFSVLLVLLFLLFLAARNPTLFQQNNLGQKNVEIKLLEQIFPDTMVIPQDDPGHYTIDGEHYYVTSLGDVNHDGDKEWVTMKLIQDQGKTYSFYTQENKSFLFIGEVPSLIWYLEEEKNTEFNINMKDLTGDGRGELLIPFENTAGNVILYRILTFDERKKLTEISVKSLASEKLESTLTFDDITTDDNFVVTTWHGTYSKGKSYYSFEENVLKLEKIVGLYGQPRSAEYEYHEIDGNGAIIYMETRIGNLWEDELMRTIK